MARSSLFFHRFETARAAVVSVAVVLLGLCFAGCTGRSNRVTVFEESTEERELGADRAFAIRVTLFEYAESAGGFVQFYGIDGAINTLAAPYFQADSCAYFGPGPIDADDFRIDVTGPMGGRLILQATRSSRRGLSVSVVDDDGLLQVEQEDAWTLSLVEAQVPAERSCEPPQ